MLGTDNADSIVRKYTALQPQSFDQVIGRSSLVHALRTRVKSSSHSMPIIIHGPSGVGKLMLARLYAKAALCSGPDASGSPCNCCDSCHECDKGRNAWVYIECKDFNFLHESQPKTIKDYKKLIEDWMSALQIKMSGPCWSDRRVVILAQADRYPAEAFDKILKVIEDNVGKARSLETVVIFLADNIDNFRRAGRSRCFIHAARRLDQQEMQTLFQQIVPVGDQKCEDCAADILIQASEGLPSRLISNWSLVSNLTDLTMASVRTALELDWVDDVATYWGTLLGDTGVPASVLRPKLGVSLSEQTRRMRVFLQSVQLKLTSQKIKVHFDPAFRHLGIDPTLAIADKLRRHARLLAIEPNALWCQLARVWLETDVSDNLGFFEAGCMSYRLVKAGKTPE